MEEIYDVIRNCWVKAFPEEIVRQNLVRLMIDTLGYPKSMIAIEKDLKLLPHLQNEEFNSNKRRLDIVCFAKNINKTYPIYPLLMIECKATDFSDKVVEQVMGYNHFVKAYFVCIANDKKVKTMWYDNCQDKLVSVDFLPSYQKLMDAVIQQ